jgi:uncharacterized repeat protein (TIGR03803 family)
MTKALQPLGTRLRALSMALAMMLFSALAAAPSGQARTYNVLYNFTGGADGSLPYFGSLVRDNAGNLYGTTDFGGSFNYGTVFKVSKSGTETVLHSFTGGSDGGYPFAGLLLSGNTLYGTTFAGGSGNGVVFEMRINTGTETVLYTFTGGSDGGSPFAGLVQDKAGNLYGTTYGGGSGSGSGYGVVYKVVPKTKKETVLHTFAGSDGKYPSSGLTLDTTGKVLYGTATDGGSSGYGVVFSLTTDAGTYTVLYNFTGGADGAFPWGSLSLGKGSILYGTAYGSGSGYGVVFQAGS